MRCSLGSDLLSLSVLLLLLRALSLLFADNGPVPFLHLVLSAIVVAIAVWFTKGMQFIVGRVLIGQQMIMANGANKQKEKVKAVHQRQRLRIQEESSHT